MTLPLRIDSCAHSAMAGHACNLASTHPFTEKWLVQSLAPAHRNSQRYARMREKLADTFEDSAHVQTRHSVRHDFETFLARSLLAESVEAAAVPA